jgi:DNA modification methylase
MTEEEAFAAAVERGAFAGMSMPYQRKEVLAEGVTMYLGDSMRILPTAPIFDACVTDPPYGIGADAAQAAAGLGRIKAAGKSKTGRGWAYYGETSWDSDRPTQELFELILSRSKVQIIWGGNYFTDYLPPSMQWLVWDKGQRDFSLADCEFAWTSQNKAARVFDFPRALALKDGKEHPTQKPLELMAWCLDQLPKTVKTVVDPFLGSGTTAVACVKRGLSVTGIERHEPYFDIACRRVAEALKAPDLFIAPPKPAEQTSLPLSPTSGAA